MIRRTTLLIMALMLCYGLSAPASALADGPVDPVATNYAARVAHTPPGVQAKVIDGYLRLWVRVSPRETAVVEDQLGAGWLRFTPAGVYENHHSLLFYESQYPVEAVPPKDISARTPPDWVKVSSGHSDEWRDGRIQAFAYQARTPGTNLLGPWSIAMTVDGVANHVSGGLYFVPTPSVVWFWPIAVIFLCAIAAWRLRSNRVDRVMAIGLTQLLFAALAFIALARLLHGRPTVSTPQICEFVAAIIAITWGELAFLRGRFPAVLPALVALFALWAGLTFLPILTHQHVLLILPGWLSRICVVVLLGGGLALVPTAMRRPLSARP